MYLTLMNTFQQILSERQTSAAIQLRIYCYFAPHSDNKQFVKNILE